VRRAMLLALVAACSSSTTTTPSTGSAPAAAPAPVAASGPHGRTQTVTFHSAALDVDKDYVVYLPAGYDAKPDARWPVFYYLHGLTGNETNWVRGGHLDEAADALGLAAIVVMPDGDDSWYADSPRPIDYAKCLADGTGLFIPKMQPHKQTCVKHHAYETYITKDLIGDVDTRFRTLARRESRAIAGLSMGGFGALELAMRHPDLFAAAASHSGVDSILYAGPHPYQKGKVELVTNPKVWGGSAMGELGTWVRAIFGDELANWQAHDPATLAAKLEPGKLALYLDCGTEDDFALQDGASYVHDILLDHKIEHAFFLGPGRHDVAFWSARVPESLKFLRDHTTR
jgi:S-formylglutathione hydrolase FrmB